MATTDRGAKARAFVLAALCLLAPSASLATSGSGELAPRHIEQWTASSARDNLGNLSRWATSERERLRLPDPLQGLNDRQRNAILKQQARADARWEHGPLSDYRASLRPNLPVVVGYFYLPSGGALLPGPRILRGEWREGLGASNSIGLDVIEGKGRCGALRTWADDTAVTYLGPTLNRAWGAFGAIEANDPSNTASLGKQELVLDTSAVGDFGRYYPPRAQSVDKSGRAVALCLVKTPDGQLSCSVNEATPPDYGFDLAAVRIASKIKVQRKDGGPILDRCVTLPINFTLP